MQTLKDKVVVITGAASGIGRALALECGRQGARLLLADLNEPGLAELSAQLHALGVTSHTQRVDAGSESDIFALAQTCQALFGAADVVVNNAGVTLVSSVEKLQTADAHWIMNINFWGVVHGCRAFLPQLRTRPEATLVNISSIFAMVSVPSQSMYNAAKAAVRGFSDSLREELRETPVKVLCVHPGGIRTNIANNARLADLSLLQVSAAQMRSSFALNARTTPEQAALAIVRALESGQTRLMIGADARIIDWIYRLLPGRASTWVTALGRRRQLAAANKP
jgi:NADP-dependent 3-hydroxy acid dehydrogenase YdfG